MSEEKTAFTIPRAGRQKTNKHSYLSVSKEDSLQDPKGYQNPGMLKFHLQNYVLFVCVTNTHPPRGFKSLDLNTVLCKFSETDKKKSGRIQ